MYYMDYYNILGITKNASGDEIKRAYRKLILVHHPDKNGGKNDEFLKIKEAYDTLSDEKKRQQYDMSENIFGKLRFAKKYDDINNNDYNKIIKNKITAEMNNAVINDYAFIDLIMRVVNFNFLDIEITIYFQMKEQYNNTYRLVDYQRVTRTNFSKRIYPNKLKQTFSGEGERSTHQTGNFIINIKVEDDVNEMVEYFIMDTDVYATVKGGENEVEFTYFDDNVYSFNKKTHGNTCTVPKKGLLYFDEELGENIRGNLFVLFV